MPVVDGFVQGIAKKTLKHVGSAQAPTLLVKKHVVNDNGGTATAGQWNLAVASNNGGSGTGNARSRIASMKL